MDLWIKGTTGCEAIHEPEPCKAKHDWDERRCGNCGVLRCIHGECSSAAVKMRDGDTPLCTDHYNAAPEPREPITGVPSGTRVPGVKAELVFGEGSA